jgi:hypothetical protein
MSSDAQVRILPASFLFAAFLPFFLFLLSFYIFFLFCFCPFCYTFALENPCNIHIGSIIEGFVSPEERKVVTVLCWVGERAADLLLATRYTMCVG